MQNYPGPPPEGHSPQATSDERTWAMVAHLGSIAGMVVGVGTLGWVAPLIIWLIKREQSRFVAFHALEELLFHLLCIAAGLVIGTILLMTCVGVLFLPLLALGALVWSVISAIKANNGEAYRYPASLRLVK